MPAGPPLPIPSDYPLACLIDLVRPIDLGRSPSDGLGVWLRGIAGTMPMYVAARGRCCRMLLSGDLGLLLGRCSHVVIREGSRPQLLPAEALIQWRALQVVTSMPCLPGPERLQAIFPGAVLDRAGFRVPVQSVAPEAVLSECLTQGITVTESRITYNLAILSGAKDPLTGGSPT
jgi:hypothetical protein